MICSCKVIPTQALKDQDNQPPHRQAFKRYKETADKLDADLVVTMDHPSAGNLDRLVVTVDCNGPKVEKRSARSAIAVTSTQSPRMG
jgi:hypothetical protein